MKDNILPKGIYFNSPRPGAPSFVVGSISIKVEDAVQFLKDNVSDKGYVNIDVLYAKDTGKPFCTLNTYVKPEVSNVVQEEKAQADLNNFSPIEYPKDEIDVADIPFK